MPITPHPRTLDDLFNRAYAIDFYQREYKWGEPHVTALLDDLFFKFDQDYRPDLDSRPESIGRYSWYYLNTVVTHDVEGTPFVVDGQQRLTTLTLLLIALYRLARQMDLDEDLLDWLKSKVYGAGSRGKAYWMGANGRDVLLERLFKTGTNAELSEEEQAQVSFRQMRANYGLIEADLRERLDTAHRLEAFIRYVLKRVELVEIRVDSAHDVAMVFEVINDRGEKLKPYEVFKGELLSQLDKDDVEATYYPIWTGAVDRLMTYDEAEIDRFFQTYFRAKYGATGADYRDFEGEYQRAVFSKKWDAVLNLKRNPDRVKHFLREELAYFAPLYARLLDLRETPGTDVHFNVKLNQHERLFLLILSAITLDDQDVEEKVDLVARLVDRHFSLLQLTNTYDTNRFTETILRLNIAIRDQPLDSIQAAFDAQLLSDIRAGSGLDVDDPFEWRLFADTGYNTLRTRFLRYFFARVEHYIADHLEEPAVNYYDLVRNSGAKQGYHVEHVLADNKQNRALFVGPDGGEDEAGFIRERNRLGGLVLLKGRDNSASNNESFQRKLKTYVHAPLVARTLLPDFHHKHPALKDLTRSEGLPFKAYESFDKTSVDERHRLYFELAKRIWGDDSFPLSDHPRPSEELAAISE